MALLAVEVSAHKRRSFLEQQATPLLHYFEAYLYPGLPKKETKKENTCAPALNILRVLCPELQGTGTVVGIIT